MVRIFRSGMRSKRASTRLAVCLFLGALPSLHSAAAQAAQTDIAVAAATTATAPQILGPAIVAGGAGTAFLYTVSAVGQKPLTYSATSLPTGLAISATTGTISGTIPSGTFTVPITVTNSVGTTERDLTLVANGTLAATPPMGWNSYDSFGGSVTESETLAAANAQLATLQPHGWDTVVVDYLWYDDVPQQKIDQDPLDANGRLLPSTVRFPSEAQGFKPLADKIHALGLKFGIHIMRGIPRQAVSKNRPIANSNYTASQAANTGDTCAWDMHMYGVRGDTAAGQAWYDALFAQYASWEIDFVKVDDMLYNTNTPYVYHGAEVTAIRNAINKSGRSIVLSLSPGPMQTSDSASLGSNANMWRMVNDFWDKSGLSNLQDVFDASGRWQGVSGLGVGHWPDGDMLPLGHIGPRSPVGGSARSSALTHNEQVSVMSLWSILPSPLIFGGNVPALTTDSTGPFTLSLLTNDEVIAVDQDRDGKKAKRVVSSGSQQVWTKALSGNRTVVGLFNRGEADVSISATLSQLGVTGPLKARDLWKRSDLDMVTTSVSATVPWRGAALILLSPVSTGGTGGGGAGGASSGGGTGGTTDGGSLGGSGGTPTDTDAGAGTSPSTTGGASTSGGATASSGGTPTSGTSGGASGSATAQGGTPASSSGGASTTPTSTGSSSSGCSCSAVGSRQNPAGLGLLLLAGLAPLARTRRRRNVPRPS